MNLPGFVRDLPFRQKLRGVLLLGSLSAILPAGIAFVAYEWHSTRELFARHLEIIADVVGKQTTTALESGQARRAEEILQTLRAEGQIEAAALYGRDGRIFARYRRAGGTSGDIPARPGPPGRRREGWDLLVFRSVLSGSETAGTILLRSDMTAASRQTLIDLAAVLLVLLAVTLTALWLSDPLGGLLMRPVSRLATAVDAVAKAQDYAVRVGGAESRDELGVLLRRFNEMLAEIQARDVALGRARAELEARVAERTRELEEANRELERFSYSVSHDLKAPLRSIDGYNRILLEEFAPSLDPQARAYLERSIAAAGRMGLLIEDFLKLARISRAEIRARRVDLSALAAEVAAERREQEPGRDMEIAIAPGLEAEGDPALLRAVLENLIDNAWKFTARQPRPRIEVGAVRQGGEAAFYVRDNGAGFDMAFRDKLFKPFERLHTGADYAGTGVGLATVRRIVERHGGRAWAEGEPGRGATFYFTLGTNGAR